MERVWKRVRRGLRVLVGSCVVASSALILTPDVSVAADAVKQVSPKTVKVSEQAAMERVIRDYLLKNPEVIRDAMMALEFRERQTKEQLASAALRANAEKLLRDPSSPVGGNPKGDVTVVEFFDYHCGYCRKVSPDMEALVASDPNVRVVYKEFPILGPESVSAARAALAANKQGRYVAFHKALMAAETFNDASLDKIAADLGMNLERFKADRADPKLSAVLDANYALASALDINGTPAFVIGQKLIPGAAGLEGLKAAVNAARQALTKK